MSSSDSHVVGHLYVQPPMCCREKPLAKCSASQEQATTMHRGPSAQQHPAVLATLEPVRLVGNRIRPRPEVYFQIVPANCTHSGFLLPAAKEEKEP